ncbi:MAG: hypothetical protein ACAI37_24355, partial [Chthoniobacter sp.]
KAILRVRDKVRLDLEKLIEMHFKTGMAMAAEALADCERGNSHTTFNQSNLTEAYFELERALHMLDDSPKSELARQTILLVQGLCARYCVDGKERARRRLEPIAMALRERAEKRTIEVFATHREWVEKYEQFLKAPFGLADPKSRRGRSGLKTGGDSARPEGPKWFSVQEDPALWCRAYRLYLDSLPPDRPGLRITCQDKPLHHFLWLSRELEEASIMRATTDFLSCYEPNCK